MVGGKGAALHEAADAANHRDEAGWSDQVLLLQPRRRFISRRSSSKPK
jgi:hypothetical protein